MKIDYASIGKRIKEARLAKGWTQAKLAEKSGIEPSNISHIERAATKLSLPTLINIANALEVTLDELAYGSLIKNNHISAMLIEDLLSECNSNEINALYEILKTSKEVLRNHNK